MPCESTGHAGVSMSEGGYRGLRLLTVPFTGGAVGLDPNTQKSHLKGLASTGCTVGISVSFVFEAVAQGIAVSDTASASTLRRDYRRQSIRPTYLRQNRSGNSKRQGGTVVLPGSVSAGSALERPTAQSARPAPPNPTSSAYIDNVWGWTADRDLDGGRNLQLISVGRGILVEATQATWLLGLAFEHNSTLYEQSEAPCRQGEGQAALAPEPWSPVALDSDCRMALYQRIDSSKDLRPYGCGFRTFFYDEEACGGDCHTHLVHVMIAQDDEDLVPDYYNPGGWGGVVAAYLVASD
ncbi:hypothetical protein MKZ38_010272 [Zalerion maritima]|uniref:Uncharacterized protein n=1 Tax=Zalerion maritima TaxID=339359 RepID=A0AAD5WLW0_9PEZI|nr:hypothetical protein MKZ38_010272 [Zalerion maritima]